MTASDIDFPTQQYVGAGPLRFGMSPDEVAEVLGQPSISTTAFNGDRSDTYDGRHLTLGFGKDKDELNHIGFSVGARATFEGRNLFGDASLLPDLLKRDGEPFKYVGFIVLLRLGMMAERADDDTDMLQTVVMFPKGHLDIYRTSFVPFVRTH